MKAQVEVLYHSSIRIAGEKILYFDPFKIDQNYNDADYIFCTHSHFDHFSKEDILKVKKDDTIIITVKSSEKEALDIVNDKEKVIIVEPNQKFTLDGIEVQTTYAYNKNKNFHPKQNKWVGFIVTLGKETYYIAGDTDDVEEIQNIACDVAFIPIGGTYTMDYKEAAEYANKINAKIVVPTHYGAIVGEKADGEKFKELVNSKEVKLLLN